MRDELSFSADTEDNPNRDSHGSSLKGGVHRAVRHDSAEKQVQGAAHYVDDILEPHGTLHALPIGAEIAHGRLISLDLEAVRSASGVRTVLTAADIPGINDCSPIAGDDPVFVEETINFHGQVLFAIVAESLRAAHQAAKLAKVEVEERPGILTIDEALAAKSWVLDPYEMKRGDSAGALKKAPRRLKGRFEIGGQDHFYLEGQVSLVVPMEDGDMFVYCSTQHPSEIQHNVARALGRPDHSVTVETRRMGGGFGGKETQASQWAVIAALGAEVTGQPVKLRLDRDDDMRMTGKRHDFVVEYDVGYDLQGQICGLEVMQATRCGYSADLSGAIADRAMFHADNGYYLGDVTITSYRCKTHTVSNTAFRGFGGPQGMLAMERILDEIALDLGQDPLDVRLLNLYGPAPRNITPYYMEVEDNLLPQMIPQLVESAEYRQRRQKIERFNAENPLQKRGLSLTPVKFGISFTTTFLNQAGALVHIYSDGSIQLNHGGTEMGQGLFIKVAQVVAEAFQVDLDRVKITATNTGKVPNTSPTAASSGSDMNGMAALSACNTIKARLVEFAAAHWDVPEDQVCFTANEVTIGKTRMPFAAFIKEAYLNRISLSSTGYYRTPKIHWDREVAKGRPFFYFSYGVAVSEILLDCLTGEYKVTRVDILHETGKSLNPAIDLGQIEGGFVQGMGWLTSEELVYDDLGRLRTHAPSTYKIPCCGDVPRDFRVELMQDVENREETIHRSKAVGEPPLMLANSVLEALYDAVAATANHKKRPLLNAPATPEAVLRAIDELAETGPEE